MKNHWKRFCGQTLVSFALGSAWLTSVACPVWGQQPGQGVAPPKTGYGGRPAGTNQPPQQQQQQQQRPGQPSPGGKPVQTQQPQSGQPQSTPGPQTQGNPNTLNPNFAQGNEVAPTANGVVTKDPFAKNPLTPQEIQYIDRVLQEWERATAGINQFQCSFRRWQYNSSANFVEQLAQQCKMDIRQVHVTASEGTVKYMAPDKGLFKEDVLVSLTGTVGANNRPDMQSSQNQDGDWWLCDGKSVYDYVRKDKKCTIHELPPEMQGTAVLDSPMPFVFGIKADKIKERYWVRALELKDAKGQPRKDALVVEIYPKFMADAVNYDHVQVFLDTRDFLPTNMVRFYPEHIDEPNTALVDRREIFEFKDREVNQTLLKKISSAILMKEFIPVEPPKDWKVERIPYAPPSADRPGAPNTPGSQNAPATPNAPKNAGNPTPLRK